MIDYHSPQRHFSAIKSRDSKLNMLYQAVMNNPSHMAHLELQDELNHRMKVDHIFEEMEKAHESKE
jgi:hypothetical protein